MTDRTPPVSNCLQPLLWLWTYTGGYTGGLDSPCATVIKNVALFCHIHLPLTGNLLIDGWGRYGKWQESLYRRFSFKCICHLAGGGEDERQLTWTLNRRRDMRPMPFGEGEGRGAKSEGWMIDRDLKWKRDTSLLSHCAYSHGVGNFQRVGIRKDLMKKDCALFLVFIGFLLLPVSLSVLVTCTPTAFSADNFSIDKVY